jgi:C-terminal processing protease CtpA/Prc
MKTTLRVVRWIGAALALGAMASCGGGGGGGSAPPAGVMAQTCSPNNPYRGDATAATTVGSLGTEKTWLRDYMDRAYLWYNEVPNVNASATAYSDENDVFGSLDNYFNDLLTPARTASNKLKDQFSFIYPTAAWDALINSGSTAGYGVEWQIVQADNSTVPPTPRSIRVAFVHTGSQAETRGIRRGDTLVQADGVSAQDNTVAGIAALNGALFPANGSLHTLSFSRAGVAGTTDYTMTASPVTLTPVRSSVLNVGGQKVGYILFNDHVLTAEAPLINAFDALRTAGVTDLVLDLRYNGGGYLFIASEVAYMIAGGGPTATAVFETTQFSNKRSGENSSTPFIDTACIADANFNCTSSAPLPTLNLNRVYVLSSGSTCSASEAIVNGLRGINLDVRLIGTTTCGKPYGFFGQDNCGITYFPIEFQGVNAKGFGDYADGFIPGGIGAAGNNVPGCAARDDLDHALGDPAEGQLAAALFHRSSNNASCLPFMASPRESPLAAAARRPATMGGVIKPAVLTNRNARMPLR